MAVYLYTAVATTGILLTLFGVSGVASVVTNRANEAVLRAKEAALRREFSDAVSQYNSLESITAILPDGRTVSCTPLGEDYSRAVNKLNGVAGRSIGWKAINKNTLPVVTPNGEED